MAEQYRYDPSEIEPRWQRVWADERTWEVSNEPDGREEAYVLEMLPYPSGEPHLGHLKNYAIGDAVAHFWRRQGYRDEGISWVIGMLRRAAGLLAE